MPKITRVFVIVALTAVIAPIYACTQKEETTSTPPAAPPAAVPSANGTVTEPQRPSRTKPGPVSAPPAPGGAVAPPGPAGAPK